jgi:uncharacterized protein
VSLERRGAVSGGPGSGVPLSVPDTREAQRKPSGRAADWPIALAAPLPDLDARLRQPLWACYKSLLNGVTPGLTVHDCVVGQVWTMVTTDQGHAGIALSHSEGLDESTLPGSVAGCDLTTAASWAISWNYYEAAIGCASINAIANTRESVEDVTGKPLEASSVDGESIIEQLARDFAGAKVAAIGHFGTIESLASECDLTVLERSPGLGDRPDPACEYLLPEQDVVLITGTTVINKTLPRLLELSRNAYTVLVGPSTPLSPVWFEHGVDLVASAVVTDPMAVRRCVQEGAHRRVFRQGLTRVQIAAKDWVR